MGAWPSAVRAAVGPRKQVTAGFTEPEPEPNNVAIRNAAESSTLEGMKAWTLNSAGAGLRLEVVPDPVVRDGGAVLRMLAVQVPAYTRALTMGGRGGIATPTVLGVGGIGRVEAVGQDVHTVRPGDIAMCTSS